MPTETVETYQNGVLVETRQVNVPQESLNADAVSDQLRSAMAVLGTLYTQADTLANSTGLMTNGQRDTAIRDLAAGVRLLARTQRRVIRWVASDYSGTD